MRAATRRCVPQDLAAMRGLGEAADRVLVLDGALDADRIGDVLDLGGQRLGAGEAEDVVDAVRSQKSMASGRP